MKKIKNQITKITIEDNKLDYNELIKIVLLTPTENGFSMNDVILTQKILKIEPVNDVISFEDEDFRFLQSKVEAHRWPNIHEDIADFLKLFK